MSLRINTLLLIVKNLNSILSFTINCCRNLAASRLPDSCARSKDDLPLYDIINRVLIITEKKLMLWYKYVNKFILHTDFGILSYFFLFLLIKYH